MNSIRQYPLVYCLMALSCGLPFLVPSIFSKITILLAVLWMLIRPSVRVVLKNTLAKIILGALLVSLLGYMYSNNKIQALAVNETLASLLVFPIVIFSSKPLLSRVDIRHILISLTVGVTLFNLTSLFFISYDLWDPKNLQTNLIAANNIIVKIHPALLSMYISFCIFFLIDQYFPLHKLNRVRLGWMIFGLAVLVVFLIWLNSRAGILAFLLAFLFFVSYRWQGRMRMVSFGSLLLLVAILVSIPFSNYRFIKTPLLVLSGNGSVNHEDPNIFPLENRLQILRCNIELMKWPQIIYGYGTGDGRDELQKCFAANNYVKPYAESMDSHSEYFGQLHRHGVIGLGLFLALLLVPFLHALKHKSPLLGAFIILFAVTAMFENVFSVQKGVTFFALFCPLLWLHANEQDASKAQSTSAEIPVQKA